MLTSQSRYLHYSFSCSSYLYYVLILSSSVVDTTYYVCTKMDVNNISGGCSKPNFCKQLRVTWNVSYLSFIDHSRIALTVRFLDCERNLEYPVNPHMSGTAGFKPRTPLRVSRVDGKDKKSNKGAAYLMLVL